jgi:DNA-binding NarL/FixJ family response regulator
MSSKSSIYQIEQRGIDRMNILLADDQKAVRSALRLLLEQESRLTVVAEAGDASELLRKTKVNRPDMVLLDWELPGCESEELIPELRARYPELIIIALSSQPEARREALYSGADGFVSKGSPPQQVIEVVRKVKHGLKGE